jgi:hypothetical protein
MQGLQVTLETWLLPEKAEVGVAMSGNSTDEWYRRDAYRNIDSTFSWQFFEWKSVCQKNIGPQTLNFDTAPMNIVTVHHVSVIVSDTASDIIELGISQNPAALRGVAEHSAVCALDGPCLQ